MAKKFKVICAWCGKTIGTCEDTDGDSHGICDKCYEKQLKQVEAAKEGRGK